MHRYHQIINELKETGDLPREAIYGPMVVLHEVWCGIYQKRECNCTPDITLQIAPKEGKRRRVEIRNGKIYKGA